MQIVSLNDAATGGTASIAVHLGFNCYDFVARVDGQEVRVIDAEPDFPEGKASPSHGGIPILFPYPNRIRAGRYFWDGKDYELPETLVAYDGSGNAIHGFCLDRPWRVTAQTEASVTAAFRISEDAPERLPLWPTDGEIEVCYSLNNNCLRADVTVRNPTDKPFPWGFGTHAYFRLPLSAGSQAEQCTIQAPVRQKWELEECLPTGRLVSPDEFERLQDAQAYDGLKLDDVYTDLEYRDGVVECRVVDPHAGLQMVQRCDAAFREIVAFTPPWTTAVCMEPYTCTTDAINLQQKDVDAGLQVLEPGQTWKGWIEIAAGPIAC